MIELEEKMFNPAYDKSIDIILYGRGKINKVVADFLMCIPNKLIDMINIDCCKVTGVNPKEEEKLAIIDAKKYYGEFDNYSYTVDSYYGSLDIVCYDDNDIKLDSLTIEPFKPLNKKQTSEILGSYTQYYDFFQTDSDAYADYYTQICSVLNFRLDKTLIGNFVTSYYNDLLNGTERSVFIPKKYVEREIHNFYSDESSLGVIENIKEKPADSLNQ